LLKKNEAMQMDNKRKDVKINDNANRIMITQAQLSATSAKLKQLQLQYQTLQERYDGLKNNIRVQ